MHVLNKLCAVCLAFTLLFVSTVPLVANASCTMMPMQQGMGHAMDMQNFKCACPLDDVRCVIECGCRFTTHLDGMPHQLAPHLITSIQFERVFMASIIRSENTSWLMADKRAIDTPPPEPSEI